jgi:hypothetical protein
MSNFSKDKLGTIHLISSLNNEFTICGIRYDHGDDKDDLGNIIDKNLSRLSWEKTNKKKITCEFCIREILNCRGVMIAKKTMLIATRNFENTP